MFKFINHDRFVEYPTAFKGQYSIRCEHLLINKSEEGNSKEWITTGYIYKSFNKDNNRFTYNAKDALGNPIFSDISELHLIKKEFRNQGENLANAIQLAQVQRLKKENPVKQNQKVERKQEIAQLRDKTKSQQREGRRINNLRTEKQLDAKQAETKANDKGSKDTPAESSSSDTTHTKNDTTQDLASERMDELSDLRANEQEMENDLEMDM